MTIQPGDKIPSVTLKRLGDSGIEDFDIAEYIAGKKVVLFGVPGAYTPTCSQKHLPGYIMRADTIRIKGVDEILCLSVNDPFVMQQWGEGLGADGKVTMLADGNADLTKALGLELDGSGFGLGTRSQRFAMVVEDGVVTGLDIEDDAGTLAISDADSCVARLAESEAA